MPLNFTLFIPSSRIKGSSNSLILYHIESVMGDYLSVNTECLGTFAFPFHSEARQLLNIPS